MPALTQHVNEKKPCSPLLQLNLKEENYFEVCADAN